MRSVIVAMSLLPCLASFTNAYAHDLPAKDILSTQATPLDLNKDQYYDVLALDAELRVTGAGDYAALVQLVTPNHLEDDGYQVFGYGRPAGMVGQMSIEHAVNGYADSTGSCHFDVWFDGEEVRQCLGPLLARFYVSSVDDDGTLSGTVREYLVPLSITERRERFGWQAIHILGIEWQPGLSQTTTIPVRVNVARAGEFIVQVWAYEKENEISYQEFSKSLSPDDVAFQIPWKSGIHVDGLEIVLSTAWQPPWGGTHERWILPVSAEK